MIEILSNDQLSKMKFDKSKIQNYPTKTPLEVVGGDAQLYHVLQNEIQHIMFIPEWYHNYLHKHHQLNLTDKDNIYQYLQDNLKNDYLFQHVKTLQFKKGTVIDAAKSIYNLVSIAKIENKGDIIDILHACYIELRNKIQDKPNSQ